MWHFKFCSLFVCVFSAGVGRSGTFVALLWLMQLCVRGIRPDIRAAVEDLRLHRMWMVQNLVSPLTFTGSQTLAFHKQIGLYICSIFIKTRWPHIVSPARACSFVYKLTRTHWGTVKSGVHTLHLFLAPLFRMCLGYIHLTQQTKKTLFCPLLQSDVWRWSSEYDDNQKIHSGGYFPNYPVYMKHHNIWKVTAVSPHRALIVCYSRCLHTVPHVLQSIKKKRNTGVILYWLIQYSYIPSLPHKRMTNQKKFWKELFRFLLSISTFTVKEAFVLFRASGVYQYTLQFGFQWPLENYQIVVHEGIIIHRTRFR